MGGKVNIEKVLGIILGVVIAIVIIVYLLVTLINTQFIPIFKTVSPTGNSTQHIKTIKIN